MAVADTVVLELEARLGEYLANLQKMETEFDRRVKAIEGKNVNLRKAGQQAKSTFLAGFAGGLAGGIIAQLDPVNIGRAMVAAFQGAADLVDFSKRVGIATDELQGLQYAAKATSASVEGFNSGLSFFNRQIGQASRGTGDLNDILVANGVSIRDAAGAIRPTNDLLYEFADLVKNAGSEQERALLIQRGFGRGAEELGTIFAEGADGIKKFVREAKEIDGIIDQEVLDRAAALDAEFDKLSQTVSANLKEALIGLSGVLVDAKEDMDELGKSTAALWNNPSYRNLVAAMLGENVARSIERGGSIGDRLGAFVGIEDIQNRSGPGRAPTGPGRKPLELNVPVKPTVIPETGTKELTDYQKALKSIRETTDAIIAQTAASASLNPLVEDYGHAVEKAAAVQELLAAAQADGLKITPELMASIQGMAEGYALASSAAEELAAKQEEQRERWEDFKDTAKDSLRGFVDDIRGGATALEALGNQLDNIASKLLDLAFDNGFKLLSGLLGGGGSSLVSPSIGMFDRGGYTGAGGKRQPKGIVHAGEYVMDADTVRNIGVDALDQIRKGKGFSMGGQVSNVPARSSGAPTYVQNTYAPVNTWSGTSEELGAMAKVQARDRADFEARSIRAFRQGKNKRMV